MLIFYINSEVYTKFGTDGGADKKLDTSGALKGAIKNVFRNPEKASIRAI
jgi:hypothetical protein